MKVDYMREPQTFRSFLPQRSSLVHTLTDSHESMGTTDSKLTKAIEESLPSTERYYGLFNVRNSLFEILNFSTLYL